MSVGQRIPGDTDPRGLLTYLASDAPDEAAMAATRLSLALEFWTTVSEGPTELADELALELLSHPRGREFARDAAYWRLSADGYTAILDAGLDVPLDLLRQLWVGGASLGSAPAVAGILADWSPSGSPLTAAVLRPYVEQLPVKARSDMYKAALSILIDDVCELTELVPALPDLSAPALEFFLAHAPTWPARLSQLLETARDATAATDR